MPMFHLGELRGGTGDAMEEFGEEMSTGGGGRVNAEVEGGLRLSGATGAGGSRRGAKEARSDWRVGLTRGTGAMERRWLERGYDEWLER